MSRGRPGPAALLPCLLLACLGAALATDCGCAGAALGSVNTLYLRVRSWGDYAEPLAVLQLGRPVSAAHFVPGRQEGAPPRFLAIGDTAGGLHLLTPGGRLVAQHQTGTNSAITALASYRLGRNTTVLLTGHASGELRLHMLQQPQAPAGGGRGRGVRGWEVELEEEGAEPAAELSLLEFFPPGAVLCGLPPAPASCSPEPQPQQPAQPEAGQPATCAAAHSGGCAPILTLQAASRGGTAAVTAVIADGVGRLAVLKHGGPKGAAARVVRTAALEQPLLAVRLSAAAAAVLGESGMASQRLSPPPAAKGGSSAPAQQRQQQAGVAGEQARIIAAAADAGTAAVAAEAIAAAAAAAGSPSTSPAFKLCRGLNGSRLVAAAFDAQFASRAYAVTDDGWLLALVVGSERAPSASGCTVKGATALPPGLLLSLPPPSPQQQQQQEQPGDDGGATHLPGTAPATVSLAALPGYVVVTAGDTLAVFNVTSAPRRPPRLLLQQLLAPLRQQFGIAAAAPQPVAQQAEQGASAAAAPPAAALLAADPAGGRHLAVALGPAWLVLYEVSLPYRAPPALGGRGSGPMAWLQLLQPVGMVLVAGVVLYRARARRGGGGSVSFAGDARLREFERLLQDPMAGATAYRRHRPAAGGWRGDDGLGGSSSEADDSQPGFPSQGTRSRSAGAAGRQTGGLLGRLSGRSGAGGSNGGSRRDLAVRSRRAAALASADNRAIVAMRAELACGSPGGGSEGEDGPDGPPQQGGGGGSLAMAADDVLMVDGGGRVSDEVSQLRQRFGQARIW